MCVRKDSQTKDDCRGPGLFLALSCLQGRPMEAAAVELLSLGPVGLQLTPGCAPTSKFESFLWSAGVAFTTHEGFSYRALRQDVWRGAELVSSSASVHPPGVAEVSADRFFAQAGAGCYGSVVMETMYPGYRLGIGEEIETAMDLGMGLAVDVSHIHIQLHQQAMTERTWERVRSYPHIRELHISANDGMRDLHRPVASDSFGLGWAIERSGDGIPLVLESYLHKVDTTARHRMIEQLLHTVEHH